MIFQFSNDLGSCQSSSFFGRRSSLGPGCCSVKMKASALSIVVPDDASISPMLLDLTGSYWAVNELLALVSSRN